MSEPLVIRQVDDTGLNLRVDRGGFPGMPMGPDGEVKFGVVFGLRMLFGAPEIDVDESTGLRSFTWQCGADGIPEIEGVTITRERAEELFTERVTELLKMAGAVEVTSNGP